MEKPITTTNKKIIVEKNVSGTLKAETDINKGSLSKDTEPNGTTELEKVIEYYNGKNSEFL